MDHAMICQVSNGVRCPSPHTSYLCRLRVFVDCGPSIGVRIPQFVRVWRCILFISFEFWWSFVETKRCWQCCEKVSILAMLRSCIPNNYHKCSRKFVISHHETSQHAQRHIYGGSGLQPHSRRLQVRVSHTAGEVVFWVYAFSKPLIPTC